MKWWIIGGLVFWFFWVQIRPAIIISSCANEYKWELQVDYPRGVELYNACIRKKGM